MNEAADRPDDEKRRVAADLLHWSVVTASLCGLPLLVFIGLAAMMADTPPREAIENVAVVTVVALILLTNVALLVLPVGRFRRVALLVSAVFNGALIAWVVVPLVGPVFRPGSEPTPSWFSILLMVIIPTAYAAASFIAVIDRVNEPPPPATG
ncbi:MAG TPA: hypothetical protein VMF30_07880 [Pirellulales bacterium]|nr:hypothetical protein [Pirellulales bacterium]